MEEVAENVNQESDEIINDQQEQDQQVEADDAPEDQQASNSEEQTIDPVKAAEVRAGKAIAAQRREFQQKIDQLARENHDLRNSGNSRNRETNNEDGEQTVYDPQTRRTYPLNTPIGLQVWREQEALRISKEESRNKTYQDAAQRILDGRLQYDDYEDSLNTLQSGMTDALGDALTGAENPAVLVNYFGKNPKELQRLSQLTPQQVAREVFKLESALHTSKKMISQTPPPLKSVNEHRNTHKDVASQSLAERESYYRQKYAR